MANEPIDDQLWLDALAGRSSNALESTQKAEVDALRTALAARRLAIDLDAARPLDKQFVNLKNRLRNEKLLVNDESPKAIKIWARILQIFSRSRKYEKLEESTWVQPNLESASVWRTVRDTSAKVSGLSSNMDNYEIPDFLKKSDVEPNQEPRRGGSLVYPSPENLVSFKSEIPEFLINFEDVFTILHSNPQMKLGEIEIELKKTESKFDVRLISSGWIFLDIEASEASLRHFETLGMAPKKGSQRIFILIKSLT